MWCLKKAVLAVAQNTQMCGLILENHPYVRIWHLKYLIIKSQAAKCQYNFW